MQFIGGIIYMFKKILVLLSALLAIMLVISSCGKKADAPSVYYLNFKPEQDVQWKALAKVYTDKTGIPVTVVTAAAGNYEQTLTAKMGTKEAPTLFQINGPKGYANWKDYCADLKDSELYKHLTDKSLAVTDKGGVWYSLCFGRLRNNL